MLANWLLQANRSQLFLPANHTDPYNHKPYKVRQTVTFEVKMHWIFVSTNRSTWELKNQTRHENVWIKYLRCFHINSEIGDEWRIIRITRETQMEMSEEKKARTGRLPGGWGKMIIALCSVVPGPSTINIVNLRLGIVIKLSYSYVSNVINHSSYILNE